MKVKIEIKIEEAIQHFLNYFQCKDQKPSAIKAYASDLHQMTAYIKENENCIYISQVNVSIISNYRKWLFNIKGFQEKTIYRKIDVISSMFNFLVEHKCVGINPVTKLLKNKKRQKLLPRPLILSPEEMEKLLMSVKKDINTYNRDVAMYTLMAYSGIKRGEAIALDWPDVDLINDTFSVDRGYEEKIKLPLHPKVKDALENLFKEHIPNPASAVFQGINGERIGTTTFNTAFTYAVNHSGIKKEKPITSHALQSYFIYTLLKNGANIIEIAHFTGHKDLNQLKVYTQLIVDEKKKNVLKTFDKNNNKIA